MIVLLSHFSSSELTDTVRETIKGKVGGVYYFVGLLVITAFIVLD